jgi:uncharacterized protein (DUF2236 family)
MNSHPDFSTWQHETLVTFASDCYTQLLAEQEANKQIRLDFKEAMQLVRILNMKENAA